jgi:hypothetical protein
VKNFLKENTDLRDAIEAEVRRELGFPVHGEVAEAAAA